MFTLYTRETRFGNLQYSFRWRKRVYTVPTRYSTEQDARDYVQDFIAAQSDETQS